MPRPLLEICVDDLVALRLAAAGGADRIELCAALDVGGLSPGDEMSRAARAATEVPLVAMVRPRAGGFRYDAAELARMEVEVELARGAGLDGVVLGALTERGELDLPALRRLVAAAGELPVTFHRAFDETPDAEVALELLIELGVARVLTSGHAPTAAEGAGALAQLVELAAGRIVVMPGGGVRAANVRALCEATGAREVHSSAGGAAGLAAGELADLLTALRAARPGDRPAFS